MIFPVKCARSAAGTQVDLPDAVGAVSTSERVGELWRVEQMLSRYGVIGSVSSMPL